MSEACAATRGYVDGSIWAASKGLVWVYSPTAAGAGVLDVHCRQKHVEAQYP